MMRSRREADSELGGKNGGSGVFISGAELHDGQPCSRPTGQRPHAASDARRNGALKGPAGIEDSEYRSARKAVLQDRKSTRLNSSHRCISYAVFCLKKKKKKTNTL